LRLVTGSAGKLAEARRIVGPDLESVALDLPEIQSLDPLEVACAKARAAASEAGGWVVVDDTGLGFEALGGFPGPLIKWLLAAVAPPGIADLATKLGNDRAVVTCVVVASDGAREVVGRAEVPGRIVAPRGDCGFGWDSVFEPDDPGGATYAELDDATKDVVGHRGKAWRALLAEIEGIEGAVSPSPRGQPAKA
jgi:non-canonical purine NTP pyrophosphatase (RdgB/HAM1 family)